MKLKENLITQMRTQIIDLEKFIEFLKGSIRLETISTVASALLADSAANSNAVVPSVKSVETPNKNLSFNDLKSAATSASSRISSSQFAPSPDQTNFSQTVKKVLVLTQLYTFLLLTCGTRSMQKKPNQPTAMKKDTLAKKHYG